ncbi:DUF1002 domain-containing protein [Fervidibacillus halotolerans]|uniref:DUF1002 domain-containing protein n=1 Tax=Fervidibacillus halotolerans TaxID=2980027 RepID=A0A9E8LZM9_9BACI|nr:DUF1002 domain-containing protein [Fervidibacillus halotolerans]WAA12501.1 DUF1002 domain-containing protein [Fervidibacillus halotolerans]
MINRFFRTTLFLMFVFLMIGQGVKAKDLSNQGVDEKNGPTIVVYGGSLTDAQKQETEKLLRVDEETDIKEITVTGEDIKKYINGDPNSRMFSSAKIKRLEAGKGIQVIQNTPENITEVTNEMYANALITAGVEDAQIIVASPVKVTGHSALTGIFKAYEVSGEKLNTERLQVANEELDLATKLAEEAGINKDEVSRLLSEIKKEIIEKNPVTKEEVEKIVEDQLKKYNMELSEEHKQMLVDLFDKIRQLDIDYDQIKNQLDNLVKDIQQKLKDAGIDEGFFQKLWNGIKSFFIQIGQFFKGLFD